MLRLQLPNDFQDSGLALPGSTPKTLIQVDSENLPYACQCPCCGSLFNIPEGLLYRIEEDALADGDLMTDEPDGSDINIDMGESGSEPSGPEPAIETGSPATEVGESNDTFV